jgi:adhesin transport system outer membrane protein
MYRKFFLALSISTSLCMPAHAWAGSISDSVTQALSSHPQIKEGLASVAAANKNIKEQRSGYFPVIGIDGEAGRIDNNDDTTRANTSSHGEALSWMGQGTVTVSQPIFSGFSVRNRVASAEDRYSAATYDLSGTGEDVALRAARAHLNLMRTRELLDLAKEYLSNIETRRKNIGLMVKGGAADEAELMQAEEIEAGAKNTRLGYEESFRQAEADYIEVVGASPSDKLEFGETRWNALIPPTIDEAVTYAASKNAHVLAAGSMVSALARETSAEKSTLLPHIDAEASYTKKDQLDVVGGELTSGRVVLKMGWNFSTGGGQLARIDKLLQQQEQAIAKRQGVIRTIEHDVRQKYTSMQIVDQQFSLLTDREKASEKILQNFLAQFEGGKQTNLQLIGAHSKVFEAKAARIDAHYRQLLSRFELLNATGRLHEAFTAEAKSPVAVPDKPAPPQKG